MTAPLCLSVFAASRRQHGAGAAKNPARNGDHPTISRRWFRDLLWRAFPGRSEREVALMASRALGVSERQVRNWLRCEHDAGLRHVTAVMLMAGAEAALAGLTPPDGRG